MSRKVLLVWKAVFSLCILIQLIACSQRSETKKNTIVSQDPFPGMIQRMELKQTESELHGQYVEEVAEQPQYQEGEWMFQAGIGQDQNLELYTNCYSDEKGNEVYKYIKQNQDWNRVKIPWCSNLEKGKIINHIYSSNMETCYVLCSEAHIESDQSQGQRDVFLYRYSETTKEFIDITPQEWFEKTDSKEEPVIAQSIGHLTVTEDDKIIYNTMYQNELHYYDPESGKNEILLNEGTFMDYAYFNRKIYFYDGKDKICIYDCDSNCIEYQYTYKPKSGSLRIATDKQGNLYGAGREGIISFDLQKGTYLLIMDGANTSLQQSQFYISDLTISENGFYIQPAAEQQDIIHIYYEEKPGSERNKKFTICSLTRQEEIQDLVLEYQQKNRDCEIDYSVCFESSEYSLIEDHIHTIITELMAGKGADLYLLDGLPGEELIQKGCFRDLSQILETDNLLPNIVDCYRNDKGEIYELPLEFSVPLNVYGKSVTAESPGIEDLLGLIQEEENADLIYEMFSETMLISYLECYTEKFLKNGQFDVLVWKQFMQLLLEGKEYMMDREYEPEIFKGRSFENLYCYQHQYEYINDPQVLITGKALCKPEYIYSYDRFIRLASMIQKSEGHYASYNHCFQPSTRIALSADSKESEEAQQFLRFTFGSHGTRRGLNTRLPINRKDLKVLLFQEKLDPDISNEERQSFLDFIDTLDKPTLQDRKLLVLLANESIKVLYDGEDVDQVGEVLKNKIELYMTE